MATFKRPPSRSLWTLVLFPFFSFSPLFSFFLFLSFYYSNSYFIYLNSIRYFVHLIWHNSTPACFEVFSILYESFWTNINMLSINNVSPVIGIPILDNMLSKIVQTWQQHFVKLCSLGGAKKSKVGFDFSSVCFPILLAPLIPKI